MWTLPDTNKAFVCSWYSGGGPTCNIYSFMC